MSRIEFDKETRDQLSRAIRGRLKTALDVEIDPFDALDLLDFLSETLGPHYYNQGLHDAQAIVKDRVDAIIEDIYVIEKPVIKR
jgi:uncharacterized protein (DUF2164 family)